MNYPLVISKEDLDVIAAGLNELPFKVAAPVFGRLQAQVMAYEAAQQKPEGNDQPGNADA
jgi:hypothetical protein